MDCLLNDGSETHTNPFGTLCGVGIDCADSVKHISDHRVLVDCGGVHGRIAVAIAMMSPVMHMANRNTSRKASGRMSLVFMVRLVCSSFLLVLGKRETINLPLAFTMLPIETFE